MKKRFRLLSALMLIILTLTSGIFTVIAMATDTPEELPALIADVPQGEVVIFEQDYEDTANNTAFAKIVKKRYNYA